MPQYSMYTTIQYTIRLAMDYVQCHTISYRTILHCTIHIHYTIPSYYTISHFTILLHYYTTYCTILQASYPRSQTSSWLLVSGLKGTWPWRLTLWRKLYRMDGNQVCSVQQGVQYKGVYTVKYSMHIACMYQCIVCCGIV